MLKLEIRNIFARARSIEFCVCASRAKQTNSLWCLFLCFSICFCCCRRCWVLLVLLKRRAQTFRLLRLSRAQLESIATLVVGLPRFFFCFKKYLFCFNRMNSLNRVLVLLMIAFAFRLLFAFRCFESAIKSNLKEQQERTNQTYKS